METECILCGGCVDICPVSCIEIIKLSSLSLSKDSYNSLINITHNETEVPVNQRMILIKKNDLCIRCGMCVKRCPVGTFIMEEKGITEGITI